MLQYSIRNAQSKVVGLMPGRVVQKTWYSIGIQGWAEGIGSPKRGKWGDKILDSTLKESSIFDPNLLLDKYFITTAQGLNNYNNNDDNNNDMNKWFL